MIESPDQPVLKFDIFYEFYKSAMAWNKILILHKKHENAEKRRKLLKDKMHSAYIAECKLQHGQFSVQDENCLQEIVEKYLKKMGMMEGDFQKSMIRHMTDVGKMQRIQQLRQQIEEG